MAERARTKTLQLYFLGGHFSALGHIANADSA